MLTLTASGSVSDYSDTSSLQQNVATSAGVDKSLVTISVAAASVIITATIAVPASTTAAALQTSLSSKLATAATASAALGVTVEAVPTVAIASPADPDGDPAGTKDDDAGLSLAAIGGIVGGGGALLLLLAAAGGAVWYHRRVLQPRELPVLHTIELACPTPGYNQLSEPGDKEGGGPASPSARQARAL